MGEQLTERIRVIEEALEAIKSHDGFDANKCAMDLNELVGAMRDIADKALNPISTDVWRDPRVKEALDEGRLASDISILDCPRCSLRGYWNEGSHFYCRRCDETFVVCSEDEEAPEGCIVARTTDVVSLADTVCEDDGP